MNTNIWRRHPRAHEGDVYRYAGAGLLVDARALCSVRLNTVTVKCAYTASADGLISFIQRGRSYPILNRIPAPRYLKRVGIIKSMRSSSKQRATHSSSCDHFLLTHNDRHCSTRYLFGHGTCGRRTPAKPHGLRYGPSQWLFPSKASPQAASTFRTLGGIFPHGQPSTHPQR